MRTREEYLEEQMKDKDFRIAYHYWEPDFFLANTLLEYRIANDWTIKELAKIIGISKKKLYAFETTTGNPTLNDLKIIADFFDSVLEINFRKKSEI